MNEPAKVIIILLLVLMQIIQVLPSLPPETSDTGQTIYFEHHHKILSCAYLAFQDEYTGYSLDLLPVGHTYFNASRNLTLIVADIFPECQLRKCDSSGASPSDCSLLKTDEAVSNENNRNVSLYCSCSLSPTLPVSYLEKDFNRNYHGAVFSPYCKNWNLDNEKTPDWNTYTTEDIRILLEVVSTKFTKISMYGVGATTLSTSYEEGNSEGLTPVVAAELNRNLVAAGRDPLAVTVGIWINYNYEDIFAEYEIGKALNATKHANLIFNETVTGITFSSDYARSKRKTNHIVHLIDHYADEARSLGVKIGIRLSICHKLLKTNYARPPPDSAKQSVTPEAEIEEGISTLTGSIHRKLDNATLEYIFKSLVHRVDYMICDYRPPTEYVFLPISQAVEKMGKDFLQIRSILNDWNGKLEVVAQTSWPSWGHNENSAPGNVSNLVEFWNYMDDWAEANSFQLLMLEAFDTPWKNDLTRENDFSAAGPIGAAGHHGWWRRYENNSNTFTYIPKVLELELFPLFDHGSKLGSKPTTVITSNWKILSLFVAVVAVMGIVVVARWWKIQKNLNHEKDKIIREFRSGCPDNHFCDKELPQSASGSDSTDYVYALRFPYDRKYELEPGSFSINKGCVLGEGNFGIVYKGSLEMEGGHGNAAFKTLNVHGCILQLKGLLSEIKIMSFVGKHENIVNLLGACTDNITKGEVYVVTEYCEHGNLENYLQQQRENFCPRWVSTMPPPLISQKTHYVQTFIGVETVPYAIPRKSITLLDLLRWSYHIANGMEHIANLKVVHADLACRNVLLTSDGVAKVADFGLSRQLIYQTQYVKTNLLDVLPWRWMAVESLRSLVFSIESDVWSYGITMWEIFTMGKVPYQGLVLPSPEFLDQLENSNYRLIPPHTSPPLIHELLHSCCLTDPSQRISFLDLKTRLYKELSEKTAEINNNSSEA